MAQIGFTDKTEHVYDRFNKMRRDYVEKHGRTYAPDFLTVLMDVFNTLENIQAFAKTLGEADQLRGKAFVLIPFWDENRIDICTPSYLVDSSPDRWDVVGSFPIGNKPVSLRAYIADAEANDPNLEPENETE